MNMCCVAQFLIQSIMQAEVLLNLYKEMSMDYELLINKIHKIVI